MCRYNKKLQLLARELRKNMTEAEKLFWLRSKRKQIAGFQFYRQRIIEDFIVDFYCPMAKLVIEIDGGQDYSGKEQRNDEVRDKRLSSLGLKVLRFSNLEVLQNIDGVLEQVYNNLKST